MVEGDTKNHRSRAIPLTPEILAELLGHRARCEMLAELAGVEILAAGFIFGRHDRFPDCSVPYRPDYVTRVSRQIAERHELDVAACHPHGLRHYFATQGIASGADVVAVAGALGQHPDVTLSTYAHPVDEARTAAVAAVGKTLAR